MTIYKFAVGILVLLSFVYFIIGLLALSHIDKSQSGDRGSSLSPWWPFNEKIYDDFGKKLCGYGKILFFVVWGGAAIWAIDKYI